MISSAEIVKRYIEFFKANGHKQIANSPLVLVNDPTTLFTSSGMQPLLPYLLGETHPQGTRLVNIQNCIRTQDIEEVGDNRHTTFFRMIGNWSLGDYFKTEEINWLWEFLTEELKLPKQHLFITVFDGIGDIPKDTEAVEIWNEVLTKSGLDPKKHIFYYSDKSNWWSRAGTPDKMPTGEPGGPSTEVFYEFTEVEHNKDFGDKCHPNCDCGRFIEIGNSVFMEYIKQDDGSFKPLPKKNIDFGGGLERISAAVNNTPDVFMTDLYDSVIKAIEKTTTKKYSDHSNQASMRIIADHLKAATFLISDGVVPANKDQGYILRRLLRRSAVKLHKLEVNLTKDVFKDILKTILKAEEKIDERLDYEKHFENINSVVSDEIERFAISLEKGLKEVEKNIDRINEIAFDVYQSHGFPYEILEELVKERGKRLDKNAFDEKAKQHRDLSRTASAGKFKGGLADHSERTIMGHTATHLLHQALRDVLGNHVHQTGSNITSERVRFDFNYENKLTDEEIENVQAIVNEKINENLSVHFELIPTQDAHKIGAIGLFMDTYGDKSKIYFIGPPASSKDKPYSIEFCGGPHVDFTGRLKSFKIIKQENLGKNQKRIYGVVG